MIINNYIQLILERFQGRSTISKEELRSVFQEWDRDLKETTFRWRIHELKQRGVIQSTGRGFFSLQPKPAFFVTASDRAKRLFKKIDKEYPGIRACVWNTADIHDLMLHQPAQTLDILEVEGPAFQLVFDRYNEFDNHSIAIKAGDQDHFNYNSSSVHTVMVKRLLTRAPIHLLHGEGYWVPMLEKILVDIFCEPDQFSAFAGSEFSYVLDSAYRRYAIDFTKLFQYAERRNKVDDMKDFILNTTEIPKNLLR